MRLRVLRPEQILRLRLIGPDYDLPVGPVVVAWRNDRDVVEDDRVVEPELKPVPEAAVDRHLDRMESLASRNILGT